MYIWRTKHGAPSVPNFTTMQNDGTKLKNDCLKKFREIYPELEKTLLDVSDLNLLIHRQKTPNRFILIDVKAPGSQHDKKDIEEQLNFGKIIKESGGEYYTIKSVSAFMVVINDKGTDGGIMDAGAIEELIKVSINNKVNF